jgi:glutathione S-transferase
VPILKLPDGSHMSESAAMMIYLADLKPEAGLTPHAADEARASYLRVMLILAASTYPAYRSFFYPSRFTFDPNGADSVRQAALRDLWRDFGVLDGLLGGKPWFTGRFSAADIYAATLLSWFEDLSNLEKRLPRLMAHYQRVKSRPKIAPVFARNEL